MAKIRIEVRPEMLKWAIERAGRNLDEVMSTDSKVESWILREKQPTLKQLEDFASTFHIPFPYLLLDAPIDEPVPIPLFRTSGRSDTMSLNLRDMIANVRHRQEWVREYMEELEFDPLPFVGRYAGESNVDYKEVAADIRNTLGLPSPLAMNANNWEDAKKILKQHIEEAGIFVSISGTVGTNTRRTIDVEECRGFVLIDDIAPFIFVNGRDAQAAQSFTLAHELAHVWLGNSRAFSGILTELANDKDEALADKIAAEFLVPEADLLSLSPKSGNIPSLAKSFKVSQIVIARRLLDIGILSRSEFFDFYREQQQKANRPKISSGGNFYATHKLRLGERFTAFLNSAVTSNNILYKDAFRLSGLSAKTYDNLLNKAHL